MQAERGLFGRDRDFPPRAGGPWPGRAALSTMGIPLSLALVVLTPAVLSVSSVGWARAGVPAAAAAEGLSLAFGYDAEADVKALQGTWRHWRGEAASGMGAATGDDLLIEGETIQFLWAGKNKGSEASFTVDASKDPKTMEITYTKGNPGQTRVAIWRMPKKGQLEICWSPLGEKKFPRKFAGRATPGAGESYVIYRSDDYKEPEDVVREMKKFEGRWVNTADQGNGLLVEDDLMTFLWGGSTKGATGRFTVDPAKKTINLVYTSGSDNGHIRNGIYRFGQGKLEICWSAYEGTTPPKKFAQRVPGGGDLYFKYVLKEK